MKKLATRGFTLVELMIVIVIIGILAAVLYPSVTQYLARWRDTNRQGALRNVGLALATYSADYSTYPVPTGTANGCLNDISGALVPTTGTPYLPTLPIDPQGKDRVVASCPSGYGYLPMASGTGSPSWSAYALAANVETPGNGNWVNTGGTLWKTYVGSGVVVFSGTVNTKLKPTDGTATTWFYVVTQ